MTSHPVCRQSWALNTGLQPQTVRLNKIHSINVLLRPVSHSAFSRSLAQSVTARLYAHLQLVMDGRCSCTFSQTNSWQSMQIYLGSNSLGTVWATGYLSVSSSVRVAAAKPPAFSSRAHDLLSLIWDIQGVTDYSCNRRILFQTPLLDHPPASLR